MKKLACCLLLIPILAHGDQRAAIQSLMNEPASLFDIVMLRLQDFIIWTRPDMALNYRIDSQSEVRSIDINASYVPDKGRIDVSASVFDRRSTPAQMEAGCGSVLVKMGDPPALPGRQLKFDSSRNLTVTPKREPRSNTLRRNYETGRHIKSQSLGE